jgi:uncharacterized coiled-coil DUF342 family protein
VVWPQELDMAKQSIATLESELKAERSKLRSLLTEQDRFERERENVLAKLRRTESVSDLLLLQYRNDGTHFTGSQDMDDVKSGLHRVKQDNHKLEAELRGMQEARIREYVSTHQCIATATVEQKARNLQAKVSENTDAIDRMRQERSMLLKDHKQLQQQYADVNEVSSMRFLRRIFSS